MANIINKNEYNMKYKNAPLPFQGQKRGFLKHFNEALDLFPDNTVYVDLFGGSGLLSRTVKDKFSQSKVIYNDYDNYSKRIKAISETNILLSKLREITSELEDKKRLMLFDKDRVVEAINEHYKEFGYVDCVTVSASVLFSGQYCTNADDFRKHTLYNRVRKSDIPQAEDYLNGLEVLSCDYKELYLKYKDVDNVVFLVDPPYLSTDTKSYTSDSYWKLKDYLDVLEVLQASRYFYFTSNKSSLVELCEWFGKKFNANPFEGATKISVTNSVNHSSRYEDIMLFK